MTAKVFKYPLGVTDRQLVKLPFKAQILTVQLQNDMPHLWALIDDEAPTFNLSSRRPPRNHEILIVGTGHPIDQRAEDLKYISTFQLNGGALVFHVFEVL
jgi:hypothetical protein